MPHSKQIKALWFLTICLGLGFCLLGYRLVDLQVLRHESLSLESNKNTQRRIERRPRRGNILDVKGNLLATSKLVRTVCADPSIIGTNYLAVAETLEPVMQINAQMLAEKLEPRYILNKEGQTNCDKYVVLKRKVDDDEWTSITNAMEHLIFCSNESALSRRYRRELNQIRQHSLFSEEDQLRVYPNGSLAAHVIGYVGADEKTLPDGTPDVQIKGRDGVEATLNTFLEGVQGWRQTEADRSNRELVAYREQNLAPRDGYTAVLTIDAGIQHIVESELAVAWEDHEPVSVACTVVRPNTGEILALANLPTFDPNHLLGSNPDARRNRVISDIAEPGSTFKIVVVSAALNENVVKLTDMVDCEGGMFHYAGYTLHDAHEKYNLLSVENVVAKSSNVGAAKIGIQLGAERLAEYIHRFGIGSTTGIQLPGEVRGIVHPLSRWSKLSITHVPMGHEVAATPLQMCLAMSAIANKGVLMRPQLIDHLEDSDGKLVARYFPQVARRVVSERAARQMVEALKAVVSTNGTGTKAQLDFYTVAGKTGTAQKAVNGHYVNHKFFSSFIGFFPADNPELCISVVFDEPNWKKGYYGSATGVPVFKRIAERAANYLAIPPEIIRNQALAATGVSAGD
ncbi:MAG: spoVD 1 [Verrucomicrobiales bacterium]|nr:spoVD 1 [Verrucomicrobiales bacterium]